MYIQPLEGDSAQYCVGVWRDPHTDFWVAVIEVEGEVYDLGLFGNFVEAGERYLTVKKLLEEAYDVHTA